MEDMLKKQLREAQIIKIQLAADSSWESALTVEKETPATNADAWMQTFEAAYLGIEVFLEPCDAETIAVFAGVRVEATSEHLAAARELILLWQASSAFSLSDFLRYMEEKMSLAGLFTGEPDFMEMGILNLWGSFGALCFWERGDGACRDAFYRALSGAGRFKSFLPAQAVIETAFATPVPHWLGCPVSRETGEGHVLSFDAVEAFFEKNPE